MYTVQEMRWNEQTNMFDYTSFIQVCKTKKAMLNYLNEIAEYKTEKEYVTDVKFDNQTELTLDYANNWTDGNGVKRQRKFRLLAKEAHVRA